MTDSSPWSDGQPLKQPTSSLSKKVISPTVIVVLLTVGFGIGILMTLIVSWATLENKERERARAVADLQVLAQKDQATQEEDRKRASDAIALLTSKAQAADSLAQGAQKLIDDAQTKASSAMRQADEASRQLGDARNDASSVRAERDEARGIAVTVRAEMDKLKLLDGNPESLPVADLSKAINEVKSVRCTSVISLKTPLLGVTDAESKIHLSQSLTGIGLTCSDQSPVEIMLLVSFSDDQPRRALGVMLLVTRMMKIPGEALSKQVAVWGQQRTSLVNQASAAVQLESLIKELVTAMSLELAIAAPTATPAVAPMATPTATPAVTAPPTPANAKP
jgi:hypothetical protein